MKHSRLTLTNARCSILTCQRVVLFFFLVTHTNSAHRAPVFFKALTVVIHSSNVNARQTNAHLLFEKKMLAFQADHNE